MTLEPVEAAPSAPAAGKPADGPVAIEVRGLHKSFHIPKHRVDSFKERAVHPFRKTEYFELKALRGIDFDVHQGEFFGVVGRNGSGKSTMLKILASIYRADAGTIRMAGQAAPFIELGVGFNQELTARENIVLNGVMMGLSQREARSRIDAVLDFAELHDFIDLKLKNYSSGMLVRLAFSVMLQAETDILLIDEVLAVGDASFQQKCADVFHEMRDGPRTVVLVTHDMGAVQTYCHRAMLIHDGEIRHIGDPEEVGREYLRANFEDQAADQSSSPIQHVADVHAKLVDSWLENDAGERITNVELGEPLHLRARIEATRELDRPVFNFLFTDAEGVNVFGFNRSLDVEHEEDAVVEAGQQAFIEATIDNILMPGRYFVGCWVWRRRGGGDVALQTMRLFAFVVYGLRDAPGLVSPRVEAEITIDEEVSR